MLHLASGQTLFDLALVAYAVLVLPVLSAINGRKLAQDAQAPLARRYTRMMLRGWLTVAALGALWRVTNRPLSALGLDIPLSLGGKIGLLAAGVAILAAIVVQLLLPRVITAERRARLREQMRAIKILPRSTLELVLFLGVSLTAGVWEELIYRGFLMGFVGAYAGIVGAVIVSTLIFGIGHIYQGWRGALNAGTLGLLFGVGYALSHSLWWLIAIHALVDMFGGVLAWRVLRMPEPAMKNTAPA